MNHNRYSVKSITIKGITERTILDKIYRSWTITDCCHTKVALEDFLEWDPYYQLDKMIKENGFGQQEVEPEECYEQANEWGGV